MWMLFFTLLLSGPSWATTYAESLDPDALRSLSSRVVLGKISSLSAHAGGPGIVTDVTVNVQETWVGRPAPALTIEVPGGHLDGRSLVIPGAPQFQEGQQVLLFLDEEDKIVGFGQGAFLVTRGVAWHGLDNASPTADGHHTPVFPLREVHRMIR